MSGIQNEAFDHEGNGLQLTHRKSGTIVNTENGNSADTASLPSNSKRTFYDKLGDLVDKYKAQIRIAWLVTLNALVIIFFGFATNHYLEKEETCLTGCGMQWCSGYGMLVLLLGFVCLGLSAWRALSCMKGKLRSASFGIVDSVTIWAAPQRELLKQMCL